MRNQDGLPALSDTDGFTLVEVIVALAVTLIMIGSVFGLMAGGQATFRRETQVANMQMSTRSGLQLLSRDLTMAGYRTPPASAIIWADGGGLQPDEITIVYADPDVALSRPLQCGAAALITGGNTTHYWEESGIVGRLYEKPLGIEGIYAWDVWLVYKPGARWDDTAPPKPDFAMQQLGASRANEVMPRLDSEEFSEVVNNYLGGLEKLR